MPRKASKTKCAATNASGADCRAWAVRGSDPPLCSAHAGLNIGAGAPLGNQNRTEHGFYGRILQNGELADLVRFSQNLSLEDEIGLVRITLRRVMTRFKLNNLERDDMANEEMMKMAGLIMTGARTVARLLRDQRALSGKAADGISGAIGLALDELSSELGIPL